MYFRHTKEELMEGMMATQQVDERLLAAHNEIMHIRDELRMHGDLPLVSQMCQGVTELLDSELWGACYPLDEAEEIRKNLERELKNKIADRN